MYMYSKSTSSLLFPWILGIIISICFVSIQISHYEIQRAHHEVKIQYSYPGRQRIPGIILEPGAGIPLPAILYGGAGLQSRSGYGEKNGTVEPLQRDRLWDRWSLVTGSIALKCVSLCQEYAVHASR